MHDTPDRTTSRFTRLARLIAPAMLLCAAACGETATEPLLAESSVARRSTLVCVARGADGHPVVTEPVGGDCPLGFDLQPWW